MSLYDMRSAKAIGDKCDRNLFTVLSHLSGDSIIQG